MAINLSKSKKPHCHQTTVHRQIEVEAICGAVYSHSRGYCDPGQCQQLSQKVNAPTQKQQTAEKYSQPKWNSVLRQVHEIEKLKKQKPPQYKSTADLTPRTKATIAPKVTQKLNFNSGQTVFKNLTPINVNDSILLPVRPTSIPKKYAKSANKAPIPELSDFLDPLPQLMHVIPEPEILQEFPKYSFDYFGSCMRFFDDI